MIQIDFRFTMLKVSVYLPRILCLYPLLIYNPFIFPSRIKYMYLGILKLLVTTLRNNYHKVVFIHMD